MAARNTRSSRNARETPQARIEQAGTGARSWIVGDDEEVIVIDAGEDAAAVLEVVGEREVAAVICTHGHASHVAGALEVAARDEAPVALHPADRPLWRETHPDDDPDIEMEDGGIFEIADVSLEVLHARGHTPGSVCLYSEDLDAVFTGDVLSAAGPVGHDGEFPDFSGQLSSIGEHLLTLPRLTRVLPGHGAELTIAKAEKKFDSWVSAGPSLLDAAADADADADDDDDDDDDDEDAYDDADDADDEDAADDDDEDAEDDADDADEDEGEDGDDEDDEDDEDDAEDDEE
jgi:glyoxylase-like metal-dependent hydrolase (beta-lactamase superfamily II)